MPLPRYFAASTVSFTHFLLGSVQRIHNEIYHPTKSMHARNALLRGNKFQTGLKPPICAPRDLRRPFDGVASPDEPPEPPCRPPRVTMTQYRQLSSVLRPCGLARTTVGVALRDASNGSHGRAPRRRMSKFLPASLRSTGFNATVRRSCCPESMSRRTLE